MLDINREIVDQVIASADFGDERFECNDGAIHESDTEAYVTIYFSRDHYEEEENSDSRAETMTIKIVDGKYSIDCESMKNCEEVEAELNKREIATTLLGKQDKEEYPRYFNCPDLNTTFKANDSVEAEKALGFGAEEVNEFVYTKLRTAYDAGHKLQKPVRKNFVVASLCDSDFSKQLSPSLSYAMNSYKSHVFSEAEIKRIIVQSVVGLVIADDSNRYQDEGINWERYQTIQQFLERRLTVSFSQDKPSIDHEGGSAYYDLNTQQAYSF